MDTYGTYSLCARGLNRGLDPWESCIGKEDWQAFEGLGGLPEPKYVRRQEVNVGIQLRRMSSAFSAGLFN
jgi:hypothetical protein